MTGILLIGIIAFFAAVIIGRSIMTNALRKLDDEMKLKFTSAFRKRNQISTAVLVTLILIFLGSMQFFPQYRVIFTVVYGVAVISFMVAKFLLNYKKLREINAPPAYMSSFRKGYGLFILGIIAPIVCALWVRFS